MIIKTTREIMKTPLRELPKDSKYNYNTKWVSFKDYQEDVQYLYSLLTDEQKEQVRKEAINSLYEDD